MNNFEFYRPTYFAFGRGQEENAGALAKRFGAKKALIHYGQESAIASGLLERIKASLESAGIACAELGGVLPNPRAELVQTGIELARRERCDFIIAVGGGSVIDSAKGIALGVPYNGDLSDFYFKGVKPVSALGLGVVLTISAAGSEGSINSVVSFENGRLKRCADSELICPKFAVLNPALTATLMPYQVACGGADIMAHLLERYLTNTRGVETTDQLIEALLRAVIIALPRAVANPADYEAQANLMWAGMVGHNNIVGVGRAQDWASHMMEHELSALYDVAHGAGLAVVFPAYMKYVLAHDTARFERLARNVFGVANGMAGIEALKSFWAGVGLPTTFAELGGKTEDIAYLAKNVPYNPEGTIGGFKPLREDDVVAIYKLMV
ncbi:MAG: iron-containing alcohol dehydrogenase [Alphaproteobacteria bacterium]|nr:iron-containing alcohol dehydrogenase [Alphaproteobacteria bacterium]